VARVAPARHPVDARVGGPGGDPLAVPGGPRGGTRVVRKKVDGLIPLTVPEVRRLLVRLVLAWAGAPGRVLAFSAWRRRHQARAKRAHYRTRKKRLVEVRL
jgi:hypothetical protein